MRNPPRRTPNATGSLLDYADRSDEPGPVADNVTSAPVSEPVAAEPESAEPVATGEDLKPLTRRDDAVEDDSMTSADFRDAEDNEDWAGDEEAAAPTSRPLRTPRKPASASDAVEAASSGRA